MLSDDIAAALPELQAQAESLMADIGQAFDPSGTRVNPVTGVPEPAFVASGLPGPCNVQGPGGGRGQDTAADTITLGGAERTILRGGLHRPINAQLLPVGWEWRITAVGAYSDPTLLGRRYRIVQSPAKTVATARRYHIVEVTWEVASNR